MKLTAIRFDKGARPFFVLWSGSILETPFRPHPEGRRPHVATQSAALTERAGRRRAKKVWAGWDERNRWACEREARAATDRDALRQTVERFYGAVQDMNERDDGEEA